VGGAGGGAIQISATNGVVITGHINVGGGGGKGGTGAASGGGGGGSGGMIILEGKIVSGAGGSLIASGGGGGQGSDGATGGDGTDAYSWRVITGGTPGGSGGAMYGGNGGTGGVRHFPVQGGDLGTSDSLNTINGSGGGGGGGWGYIYVRALLMGATLPDGGVVQPCIFGQAGTPSCVVSPNLDSNLGTNCDNGAP
jgi:hypothetical protein